ncbi:universal stress protein [Salinimicrobium catena]|uniref:universal stress protein n=1 Tax=Salinimicrobium catena TaxID=390640 RepID=UPI002FE450A6
MKNILLPTDFSKCSTNAILYVLNLFKGTSCTFHLLSVYKSSSYTSGDLMQASTDASLYDILISENKLKLDKLIAKMEKNCAGEDFYYNAITDYNVFTDSINKFIETENIDLIAMGTDGVSDAQERIFGSHTLRVIRKVDSPLLIIPENATFHSLRQLLLSLDQTVEFEKEALQPLLKLIGNHSFSLHILKITKTDADPEAETEEEMNLKQHFEIYNPSYHKVSDVPVNEAINTFVQSMEIDMNILPVKKEEFLERLFGSNLSKIIYSTTIPLFILHSKEEGDEKDEE